MATSIAKHRSVCWLLPLVVMTSYYSSLATALTTIQPLSLQVLAGYSASFECSTDDTSDLPWQWFKVTDMGVQNIALESQFTLDGFELLVENGTRFSRITKLNVSTDDDQTLYYCQYGAVSQMATLTVITPAGLDSRYPQCDVDITSANTEKMVTFTCSASGGNPQPSLQWYSADNTLMEQDEFACFDNRSYCVQFKHFLSVENEGEIFNCKAEGSAVTGNQNCSATLRIPPTVIVSSESTALYDGDAVELVCAVETPWRVVDYQWYVNNQLVTSSELQFHLENNGRVILISDLDTNHARIEIGCNVTTASGLVGSDRLYIEYINKRFDISQVILIVCFSFAVVGAFIVGICISKVMKCNNLSRNVNSTIAMDKLTQNKGDCQHEYETVSVSDKPATPNQIKSKATGYTALEKTSASTYKELNPSPIDLDHSEYMSFEA